MPAILLNNRPDVGYHTSEDRAFNADPTQLKRAAFIGVASMSTMANAGGAVRVAEVTVGNAPQRAGAQLGLALQMVGEGGSLAEARNLVRQAYLREGEAIRPAAILAENAEAKNKIEAIAKTFVETGEPADMARLGKIRGAHGGRRQRLASDKRG